VDKIGVEQVERVDETLALGWSYSLGLSGDGEFRMGLVARRGTGPRLNDWYWAPGVCLGKEGECWENRYG